MKPPTNSTRPRFPCFGLPGDDDRVHVITVPDWLPPSANQFIGRHWRELDRLKKETANYISFYAYMARAKMVDHQYRPVREVMVFAEYTTHEPDPDNLNKVLRDSLKRCRLIVDDSSKWATFHEPRVTKGAVKKTEILLRDLELMPAIPADQDPEFKRFLSKYRKKN